MADPKLFPITALSPAAVEVLGQLFVNGPTWDGNIINKDGRSELILIGLADRYSGFTQLTSQGLLTAVECDVKGRPDQGWARKQAGR